MADFLIENRLFSQSVLTGNSIDSGNSNRVTTKFEDALKQFINDNEGTFLSSTRQATDDPDDWRNMSDEEWEKLLRRIDADIQDMVEAVKEEMEEAMKL